MNRNYFIHIVYIILFSLVSCNLEPLPADQLPSFNKLYRVSEDIEAVDFICKPDQSGYIIIGNLKSNDDSDIIIIDVGIDGMQKNLYRVNTEEYDEAVSIKLNEDDNSALILAHRIRSNQIQDGIDQNIILKTNLDGIPFGGNNEIPEDSSSAIIKILKSENENSIIQLHDFLISGQNIIGVGQIRETNNGNTSRVTQIFDVSSVDFNNTIDSTILAFRQKPDNPIYNNSKLIKIKEGNVPSAVYEVFGQNESENPDGEEREPSLNISWDAYTDLESSAGEPIFIGTDRNDVFGDILFHSNGKNYIAGNYENSDTIFIITKDYTGFNNNRGQEIYSLTGYGNQVTSLSEDSDGNIIMSTIVESEIQNTSHILKFSQSGQPIEGQDFEFKSTGLNNTVKKIESEPGNILVILSQKTFDNNSTAIGLMKIKF
ncbi:hypothetical protein ABWH96_14020 [Marivirga tractuosa]|uniref:hypothetical protein n=1 Tax=Marivirga tractuosa TaxID=1006 RepID=UPI0035CE927A